MAGAPVACTVELEVVVVELEDGTAEDEFGKFEPVVPVEMSTPVDVPTLAFCEDLHADAKETDEMAAPAAKKPALFRTWRLVNLVIRKIPFFPWICFFSFSAILTPL